MRRLLAVLGQDVSRSLSPLIHTKAAHACDLDVAYVPISIPRLADFPERVEALRLLGALGANVTIPYKTLALEICDRLSSTARAIGAVNTLTFAEDGHLQGDNTDGPGMVRILESLPESARERVQILGAGGAARAVAWALAQLGTRTHVVARRGAEEVAALARGRAHGLERVSGVTLVVSAVPGTPELAREAFASWIDHRHRPIVCDLAYSGRTRESPLALLARSQGLHAFDGRVLLAEQGALSLALWTGGDLARIRASMRDTLALPPHFDSYAGGD